MITTEAEPSPLKKHTRVISKFLETYKLHGSSSKNIGEPEQREENTSGRPGRNEKELFARLERELSSIVEVFQRER